jgi:acetyl-CoA acetyltransferase
MGEVFVVGVSSGRSGEQLGSAALAREAAQTALEDAGVPGTAITAVFVGSGSHGRVPNVEAVAVRLGLRRLGLRAHRGGDEAAGAAGRVECVSSSAVEALNRAFRAVELGIDDLVLCIGSEPDTAAALPWESWPPREVLRARACAARRYLAASGTTATQLARVVTKNRVHGAARGVVRELALSDVVNGDVAEWPLTRPMVAGCGRGAAAVVLASARAARRLARAGTRVRASVLVAAGAHGDPEATVRAGRLAYGDAGLGPDDLDCAELHDATAADELAAYEQLGIVPEGHAGELLDSGFTEAGGVLPVNLSGGLLSLGERPGAAAVAQVAELTRQLRGDASAHRVSGARAALAHCAGRPGGAGGGVVGVTVLTL